MALSSTVRPWLGLIRLAGLPSAISNIGVGFLIGNGSWQPWQTFVLLLLSTTCLYSAGMILNDWHDYQRDLRERPARPLPSGKISRRSAGWAGCGFLILGIAFAGGITILADSPFGVNWRPLLISTFLATAILLYDVVFKASIIAPLLMGSCRGLNVLLGASAGEIAGSGWLGFSWTIWLVALGVAVLISGVTWFARNEAGSSNRADLIGGGLVQLLGISILASLPVWPAVRLELQIGNRGLLFPALFMAIAFPIARRAWTAATQRQNQQIQLAVRTALGSLIIIDASICILAGHGNLAYGLIVLALLPLSFALRAAGDVT